MKYSGIEVQREGGLGLIYSVQVGDEEGLALYVQFC